jgi:beta-lactam-binding protein with PASTA domain
VTSKTGRVVKQIPKVGASNAVGSKVNLTVG